MHDKEQSTDKQAMEQLQDKRLPYAKPTVTTTSLAMLENVFMAACQYWGLCRGSSAPAA